MTAPDPLAAAVAAARIAVDAALEALLPRPAGLNARVPEAMRYAVMGGGKRLRPFLVVQSAALHGADAAGAVRVGAAIEALHTYSLVHDDLPCMDDDDLRRGRPTTHKAYDEATAVLAGDGLLTWAFAVLAAPATHPDGNVRARLVAALADAAGAAGMIGGQSMDMLAAERRYDVEGVIELQRLKTGALFAFCTAAGTILADAGAEAEARMAAYAEDFGLLFQITDDILDATGDAAAAGKAVGKDAGAGKATLVSLWGLERARAQALRLARSAADALAAYGPEAAALRALPFSLLDRHA